MSDPLAELRDRVVALSQGHPEPVWVDGLKLFTTTATTQPLGTVTEPVLALVLQGAKRSVLSDQVFDYPAGHYLVVAVDLPLTSQITDASPTGPFVAASLPLDPAVIAELLIEAGTNGHPKHSGPALATNRADPALIDAMTRLLRLHGSPQDRRILAPAVRREIHWRLLAGPQGALVRQIGLADSTLTAVSKAITLIKDGYDQTLRIDDVATSVGLSVATLNRHFRAATSLSPIQYQKQLRLQRARIRLLTDPTDVAGIGHEVGYDSASQFSREYRRMFGLPPGEDARRLQTAAVVRE